MTGAFVWLLLGVCYTYLLGWVALFQFSGAGHGPEGPSNLVFTTYRNPFIWMGVFTMAGLSFLRVFAVMTAAAIATYWVLTFSPSGVETIKHVRWLDGGVGFLIFFFIVHIGITVTLFAKAVRSLFKQGVKPTSPA